MRVRAAACAPDLVYGGRPLVSRAHDVDAVADKTRHDEEGSPAGRVAEAARAGVPAGVVDLVAHVRHVQLVDNLRTLASVSSHC